MSFFLLYARWRLGLLGLESGSEKGVFWKRGLFRKVHFLEILENPQSVENEGESNHSLEILENLEILAIREVSLV